MATNVEQLQVITNMITSCDSSDYRVLKKRNLEFTKLQKWKTSKEQITNSGAARF